MVPYKKDGHEYILVANSSRGVMKLKADDLGSYEQIDSPTVPNPPTNIAGVPYDTLQRPQGRAAHRAHRRRERSASHRRVHWPVVCSRSAEGPLNLQTIALP